MTAAKIALVRTADRVTGIPQAIDLLGINPGTLRGRMRKLGISFGRNSR